LLIVRESPFGLVAMFSVVFSTLFAVLNGKFTTRFTVEQPEKVASSITAAKTSDQYRETRNVLFLLVI
jgi:hypothetical protein